MKYALKDKVRIKDTGEEGTITWCSLLEGDYCVMIGPNRFDCREQWYKEEELESIKEEVKHEDTGNVTESVEEGAVHSDSYAFSDLDLPDLG